MPFDAQHIVGTLISTAFVLFFMYRRFRRNFGKQLLRRGYLIFRMTLLSAIGAVFLYLIFEIAYSEVLALTIVGGLAIGIGLGVWAAKHLRFENHDGRLYYIPHTYAGMIVTALFIGRLVYRFILKSSFFSSNNVIHAGSSSPDDLGGALASILNPVTLGIFFILIGYYVLYYAYVLWESKHLKPGDFEDQSPAMPKA
jgi:hypothetical protein